MISLSLLTPVALHALSLYNSHAYIVRVRAWEDSSSSDQNQGDDSYGPKNVLLCYENLYNPKPAPGAVPGILPLLSSFSFQDRVLVLPRHQIGAAYLSS